MAGTDVEDDCTSCRVIGGLVPVALSGYTLNTYYKNVMGTSKNVLSHCVYLSLAGGRLAWYPTSSMAAADPVVSVKDCFSSSKVTKMRLCDVDAIGFDLDHTLAKYSIKELHPLVFQCITSHLVEVKNYPKSLIEEPFEKYKDLCFRGLIFDTNRGNLLKVSADGKILRATHGTKPMPVEEIQRIYGKECKFEHVETIASNVDNIKGTWIVLENFFDVPYGVAAARAIDSVDAKAGCCIGEYNIWEDVLDAARAAYQGENYSLGSGKFFCAMKDEREKRLYKVRKDIAEWLKKIKGQKVITFMLTSSFFMFSKLIMDYIFDSDWRDYFDLYLCAARKPGFFTKKNPFLLVGCPEECGEVTEMELGQCYAHGNAERLTEFIGEKTGKENPKIVYVGDSIRSDIFTTKRFANWQNILILEELRGEGWENSKDSYPEEQVSVTSNFWGSFFHDELAGSVNGKKYPNTLWARLMYTYADVVIPGLEYITDLPLSHEFCVFNGDQKVHGFYPAPPKALQY